ncbi:Os05g0582450 [Oryza sativa Japonica Group]|uniref:Os05g0582450 protein n=1 Tax=Oryza sativa subsp. japonica TaxID=39947 RepID=A0A0N7KLB3_ORYSJ|nr:hypothetical protein EE612_031368 [Oryza sativa]BAS95537.1 Os05g0582450 [Oryza sativa Japonica Group]
MLKNIVHLLDRHLLSSVQINGRAHNPIASLTNDFLDPVPVRITILCKKLLRRALLPLLLLHSAPLQISPPRPTPTAPPSNPPRDNPKRAATRIPPAPHKSTPRESRAPPLPARGR